MKRTRRIEIVRYTRRVTQTRDEADATAKAEYAAAIGALSMSPGDTRSAPDQSDDASGQPVESEARTTQRRSWFWLAWLKRE